MKQVFLLFAFVLLLPSGATSQTKSLAQDTLAFRTYLSDNIGRYLDMRLLMSTYRRLAAKHDGSEILRSNIEPPVAAYREPNYVGPPEGRVDLVLYGDINVGDWYPTKSNYGNIDNAKLPDSLRTRIKQAFEKYHSPNGAFHRYECEGYENVRYEFRHKKTNAQKKKEQLIRDLQAFDSLSSHKPTFFATIYSVYGGDIRRYVEDLHKKTILGSRRKLAWFLRFPTARKLQNDLSVQFTISLALYDLWIERVRRGEITEPEATPELPATENGN